ncbi:saccharopine dehydrogenase family protein [Actinophytocola sp.]|uniref:saccharopine dehydrogenase family protein n=1 Tax=Actinophytocola sp. TaxID=1872138 RepID=UPI003D6BBC57
MTTTLIYGAAGYIGALTARRCREAGLAPILAGRRSVRLTALALELGLPTREFALDDPVTLRTALRDVDVVLNAAGPFEFSAPPLLSACLATETHYLDFAGEVPAFQIAAAHDDAAQRAGIMIMPGVGFGVVATDTVAAHVCGRIEDASRLDLAFRTVGGVSRGTAGVLLPTLHHSGVTYRDGALVPARPAHASLRIDYGDGRRRTSVMNPWRADLFTAPRSTNVHTVTTYQQLPAPIRFLMRVGPRLRQLLDSRAWQTAIAALIRRLPAGPTDAQLAVGSVQVWARSSNDSGDTATALLTGPEAYEFTALAARAMLSRVASGHVSKGFHTPVTAYGTTLTADIPGTTITDIALHS